MKFNSIIRNKPPVEVENKKEIMFRSFFVIVSAIINNFFCFVLGYYFCNTRNFFFLAMTILLLLFNIEFEYIKGELGVKVIRNV